MGCLFHRTPFSKSVGDSSCKGGVCFSIKLCFWWHLLKPQKLYCRKKVFVKNNSKGRLISINVLEFVSIIVNYCASLLALELDNPTNDPHPILMNEADNTSSSSKSWVLPVELIPIFLGSGIYSYSLIPEFWSGMFWVFSRVRIPLYTPYLAQKRSHFDLNEDKSVPAKSNEKSQLQSETVVRYYSTCGMN